MVSRPVCPECGSKMKAYHSRFGDSDTPANKASWRRTGWNCYADGCTYSIRTFFMPPISPP